MILGDFIALTMEEPELFWINEHIIYPGTQQVFQRSQISKQGIYREIKKHHKFHHIISLHLLSVLLNSKHVSIVTCGSIDTCRLIDIGIRVTSDQSSSLRRVI